jgi:hypothetical protein
MKKGIVVILTIALLSLTSICISSVAEDDEVYGGYLRVYVTEITSRWNGNDGNPFNVAFLNFAFNEEISINYNDTYEDTIVWNATEAGFPGIQEDNVMILAAVFNSEIHQGYAASSDGNPFDAYYLDAFAAATPGNSGNNTVTENFTHTVFCEVATATWCRGCPIASDAIFNISEMYDYPFYYVSLVQDKSAEAETRLQDDYNILGYPTCFFDGGYEVQLGPASLESVYLDKIQSCGQRDVHELDCTASVNWLGNDSIEISVDITNNEKTADVTPSDTTGTPGFELVFIIGAFVLILFWKRKK